MKLFYFGFKSCIFYFSNKNKLSNILVNSKFNLAKTLIAKIKNIL